MPDKQKDTDVITKINKSVKGKFKEIVLEDDKIDQTDQTDKIENFYKALYTTLGQKYVSAFLFPTETEKETNTVVNKDINDKILNKIKEIINKNSKEIKKIEDIKKSTNTLLNEINIKLDFLENNTPLSKRTLPIILLKQSPKQSSNQSTQKDMLHIYISTINYNPICLGFTDNKEAEKQLYLNIIKYKDLLNKNR